MKYALLGTAVLLGLVTSLCGWRWASSAHWGPTTGPPSTLPNSSTTSIPLVFSSTQQTTTDRSNITNSNTTAPPLSLVTSNVSVNVIESTTTGLTNSTSEDGVLIADETVGKNLSQSLNSTDDDVDYVNMGQEMLIEATTILDTGIWDFEKRTDEGDTIFSRQLGNGNMVYRLTGIIDMPAQDLLIIIYDGQADYPKWNPSLLDCRVLEKINDQTDISYTVSAPGARGYVASRDFVSLRHWEMQDNTYVAASMSIEFAGAPSNPDYIRGHNGPGCMALRPLSSDQSKTEFRWLLNTKLNGWIPAYIADKAYKKFMTKYMSFLREYCKIIKQRTYDFTLSSTTTTNNVTDKLS